MLCVKADIILGLIIILGSLLVIYNDTKKNKERIINIYKYFKSKFNLILKQPVNIPYCWYLYCYR